jgi:tetratricopeptide (TPR) repeat protein
LIDLSQFRLAEWPTLGADYGSVEITFERKGSRWALLVAALIVALFFSYQAIRLWIADYRINSNSLNAIERGAALEPGNGQAWDILGRFQEMDFAANDPKEAIKAFKKAIQDDPLSAYYWMNLASAYEATGDMAQAQDAFDHARKVYPLSAQVAWNYGNFLLRQQEPEEGYAQIQSAIRSDPSLLQLAISRTWRSSHDVNMLIDHVLPADADAYFEALDFFASIQQAQPGLVVWRRLISLGKAIALPRSFPFFDELIREDRSADASRVWREALRAAGLPYQEPQNGSQVWNGDFTSSFANGGLDWRWNNPLGVAIDFDSPMPGHGGRSVRLDFGGGTNPEVDYPFENAPVEPNRTYHFRGYLRTESISTENGMRFFVSDPNHTNAVILKTENLIGTNLWTAAELTVTTGPQTHFLQVRLFRDVSRLFDNKLSGTVWIADVSLVPSGADDAGPQR